MQQAIILICAVAETQNISTMLLHRLEPIKVSFRCCSFRLIGRASHGSKVLHHFRLGNRLLTVGTLLDVLHAVVVMELECQLRHVLTAVAKKD